MKVAKVRQLLVCLLYKIAKMKLNSLAYHCILWVLVFRHFIFYLDTVKTWVQITSTNIPLRKILIFLSVV